MGMTQHKIFVEVLAVYPLVEVRLQGKKTHHEDLWSAL
jgi:hypothetical protein